MKKLGRIAAAPAAASAATASTTQPHRKDAAGSPRHRRLGVRAHRVDDYSRLAYAEVLPDEKAHRGGFLRRAVAFYRRYGIAKPLSA